ncbi:hypothetical protein FLA_4573 [Filimonas lacunae]|nr:hypothetical protein FLA_4573 [Filimonas lacunae]
MRRQAFLLLCYLCLVKEMIKSVSVFLSIAVKVNDESCYLHDVLLLLPAATI